MSKYDDFWKLDAEMYSFEIEKWSTFLSKDGDYICPGCYCAIPTLKTMIMHLNDRHGFSFENIADWLDKNCSPIYIN